MTWTRSHTLALAKQACTHCLGLGMRPGRHAKETVCACVLREIFRICHNRFRACLTAPPRIAQSRMYEQVYRAGKFRPANPGSAACGKPERLRYGYPDQEYVADFLLIAKRVLGEGTLAHRIFKWHHLYGADFRLVNRKLGRPFEERGTFHDFYRIEQKLGRAFAELEPYALYPLDEYFGGRVEREASLVSIEPEAKQRVLKFPLKAKAA